jgi:hypothetical protein
MSGTWIPPTAQWEHLLATLDVRDMSPQVKIVLPFDFGYPLETKWVSCERVPKGPSSKCRGSCCDPTRNIQIPVLEAIGAPPTTPIVDDMTQILFPQVWTIIECPLRAETDLTVLSKQICDIPASCWATNKLDYLKLYHSMDGFDPDQSTH